MKVRKYQASEEKTILTALIVHTGVLSRIVQHLGRQKPPFKTKWSNIVARWCFEYFARYRKAPRGLIHQIFLRYAQKEKDENSVEIIESFLASLSDDYKALSREINEDWVIDL